MELASKLAAAIVFAGSLAFGTGCAAPAEEGDDVAEELGDETMDGDEGVAEATQAASSGCTTTIATPSFDAESYRLAGSGTVKCSGSGTYKIVLSVQSLDEETNKWANASSSTTEWGGGKRLVTARASSEGVLGCSTYRTRSSISKRVNGAWQFVKSHTSARYYTSCG